MATAPELGKAFKQYSDEVNKIFKKRHKKGEYIWKPIDVVAGWLEVIKLELELAAQEEQKEPHIIKTDVIRYEIGGGSHTTGKQKKGRGLPSEDIQDNNFN